MKKTQIKIAIADDHTIFRKAIIDMISAQGDGKVILDAINGKELIEKIERSPELPDVCIIDINMPVMNGYDTVLAIKEKWPTIKVLALSMINEEFSAIKMLRNGANGYIVKDCDPRDLHDAILGVYNNTYYHSELVTSRMIHSLQHNKDITNISEKEMELLKYSCSDLTYKQIAEKMHVSPRTIDDYRDALFAKLNVKSRTALALFALRMGVCTP